MYHVWVSVVTFLLGLAGYGVQRQQYFSCIVGVSSIGGGNQSTWKKTHTCCKSLYHIILYRVHLAMSWNRTEYSQL